MSPNTSSQEVKTIRDRLYKVTCLLSTLEQTVQDLQDRLNNSPKPLTAANATETSTPPTTIEDSLNDIIRRLDAAINELSQLSDRI